MKDNLEKFIAENRDQFDMFEPDEGLWKGIESRTNKKKRFTLGTKAILWRAAAVVVIFMISFTVQEYLHRNDMMIGKRDRKIETDIIPELKEAEIYYTTLVSDRLNEIQPLIGEFPDLNEDLQSEMAELDSVYENLKNDLVDNIANDEVVEAMIQNYRLKLNILEDLLSYLQETSKNNENGSNELEI